MSNSIRNEEDKLKKYIRPEYVGHFGCFFDSLANLLYFLGDSFTAQRVIQNWMGYPLMTNNYGSCFGTQTRIVQQLTNGRYTASLLTAQENFADLENIINSAYESEEAKRFVQIFKEENAKGKVFACEDGRISFNLPAIVIMPKSYSLIGGNGIAFPLEINNRAHAAVQVAPKIFIDSGLVVEYDIHKLGIMGVVTLQEAEVEV